jgi:hypothetical protein
VNVIKKIASAPFRALASLFGDDSGDLDAVTFEAGVASVPPPEVEKLVQLAGALKKRPNLKIIVQGGYSPQMDGLVLRDLNIRRTLSQKMGVELQAEEDPGPIDFDNVKAMEALTVLFVERLGQAELEAVRTENLQSGEDKVEEKTQPDPKGAEDNTRLLSEKMYTRLVESESLDSNLLKQLAEERAKRIIDELTVNGGLDAARAETGKIHELEPQKQIKAKLDLTAM